MEAKRFILSHIAAQLLFNTNPSVCEVGHSIGELTLRSVHLEYKPLLLLYCGDVITNLLSIGNNTHVRMENIKTLCYRMLDVYDTEYTEFVRVTCDLFLHFYTRGNYEDSVCIRELIDLFTTLRNIIIGGEITDDDMNRVHVANVFVDELYKECGVLDAHEINLRVKLVGGNGFLSRGSPSILRMSDDELKFRSNNRCEYTYGFDSDDKLKLYT